MYSLVGVCIYTVSISLFLLLFISSSFFGLHHILVSGKNASSCPPRFTHRAKAKACCCCVTFNAQRRWYVDDQSHYRVKRNKTSGKSRKFRSSNKFIPSFCVYKKNIFLHILIFGICVVDNKNTSHKKVFEYVWNMTSLRAYEKIARAKILLSTYCSSWFVLIHFPINHSFCDLNKTLLFH